MLRKSLGWPILEAVFFGLVSVCSGLMSIYGAGMVGFVPEIFSYEKHRMVGRAHCDH